MVRYQIYYRLTNQPGWHKAGYSCTKEQLLEDYASRRDKYDEGFRKAVKVTETAVRFVTEITIEEVE